MALQGEAAMRAIYNEPMLTDEQYTNHMNAMAGTNLGNGTYASIADENQVYADPKYHRPDDLGAIGSYWNGGSWLRVDSEALKPAALAGIDIWYKWDDPTTRYTYTGTWTSETDTANAYMRHYTKSSTATDIAVFEGVAWSDAKVNMKVGGGQGTVKIYFDNGGGYDAGCYIGYGERGTRIAIARLS